MKLPSKKTLGTTTVLLTGLAGLFVAAQPAPPAGDNVFPVTIQIDATKIKGDLHPIWRFFGADEPNYAYMKDGKKLLTELGQIGTPTVYFRTHSLLVTGDGTPALKWGSTNAYTEDAQGNPVYDWTIVDKIFDTYHERGVKPYVQIGFMPEALSTHPEPYQHHWKPGDPYGTIVTGWAYPPKDYQKWGELVYQWAKHCGERYGADEVRSWYWEVWNEPNGYWKGTHEDYFKLYDYAVDGVRRALPDAKVGGAETAGGPGGTLLKEFLEHCAHGTNYVTGKQGSPIDFISFHAKGSPKFVDGHVEMGISNQLKNMNDAFAVIAGFPEMKDKPIVIGESDPDGCAACTGPQLGYRNGTLYSSYTAASFARAFEIADQHGVNLDGALTWAFEFEDQPYFAGHRVLATNGIDLPVLNTFRMFGKMGGQRLAIQSSADAGAQDMIKNGVRGNPDVYALTGLEPKKLSIMVWNYHDDDVPGPTAAVDLQLSGLPLDTGNARLTHYRIDQDHSNAYTAWQKMGSPQQPSADQYAELEKAGQLALLNDPESVPFQGGKASIKINLPRQAVSLLVLEWN